MKLMRHLLQLLLLATTAGCDLVPAHSENWIDPEICQFEQFQKECDDIKGWYQHVQRPDVNSGCCGVGDAYWADKLRIEDGRMGIMHLTN